MRRWPACGGDLGRLTREGREAAEEQLASVTAGLLDLDVGDLLIFGTVTGPLTLEQPGGDVDVVNQQQQINLHLIVNLGHGVALLPAGDG